MGGGSGKSAICSSATERKPNIASPSTYGFTPLPLRRFGFSNASRSIVICELRGVTPFLFWVFLGDELASPNDANYHHGEDENRKSDG